MVLPQFQVLSSIWVIDEGAIEIAQAILLLRIFSRKSQRYGGNSVAISVANSDYR
jgi:hypothetical protein